MRPIPKQKHVKQHMQQIDLFADDHVETSADVPNWPELPEQTRAALIVLMARMILEHAGRSRTHLTEDAGHDL